MNLNKSLLNESGLPIKETDNGIVFGKDIGKTFFQEKNYKRYKHFFQNKLLDKDNALYYIYRRVSFLKDIKLFESNDLRYDLTLIFPNIIGNEISHTIGHFHKKSKDGISYPEIYQVIDGSALFLLQGKDEKQFYAIDAKVGNMVIVPPGFGHITVNTSLRTPLLIANIFTSDIDVSDYSLFEEHSGAMWYPEIIDNKISLKENKFYKNHTGVKYLNAENVNNVFSLSSNILYSSFINNPTKFNFLNNPKKFLDKLNSDSLFGV